MNVISFKPNSFTHKRLKAKKEAERQRLINKIGINQEDAPLFEEELRFWAYEESRKERGSI